MNRTIEPSRRRRAVVAPYAAVLMLVMLGFVALSVDVGHMYVANEEMQNAADSGALAGASGLTDGKSVAQARAIAFASSNAVAAHTVSEQEVGVEIGNWDGVSQTFVPLVIGDPVEPKAVHTTGTRPQLPLFFACLMGYASTEVKRDAVAVAGAGTCAGIWGLDLVDSNGSIVTDSYDSQEGPYGPGNIRAHGDVCSNRDMGLGGSIEIHGDAMYGDGYNLSTSGSTFEVWGRLDDHTNEAVPPPFDINQARVFNDNDTIGLTDHGRNPFQGHTTNLRLVEDDNLTLAPGTYYFRSIMIVGQATLTVTGPTNIYVGDDAHFGGGGLINTTQDPRNLTIYSAGQTMDLAGGAAFYGSIVAPQTTVNLTGTSAYYGTLMAGTLVMRGDNVIHVDERLVYDMFGMDPLTPILVE